MLKWLVVDRARFIQTPEPFPPIGHFFFSGRLIAFALSS
jgi:hypothetical protein